jgi:pyruvate/2-oxoglutarate dehydrogenase complex dihydrolipoamide acyltransferase (E2) component
MNLPVLRLGGGPVLVLALALVGCKGGRPAGETPEVVVSVAQLKEGDALDYEEFTGRTEAVKTVDVQARATGYLEKVLFKDGDDVKKGQLLYEIDDRTYATEVKNIEGAIARTQAARLAPPQGEEADPVLAQIDFGPDQPVGPDLRQRSGPAEQRHLVGAVAPPEVGQPARRPLARLDLPPRREGPPAEGDLQERADRLACEQGEAPEGAAVPPPELLGAVQLAWPAQARRAAARPAAR